MDPLDFTQPIPLSLADLDHGVYLNHVPFPADDEFGYLADDGAPGSTAGLNDDAGILSIASPAGRTAKGSSNSGQRQRSERRGHTKSRRGCYNCKRRRIKCQETRPACGHCVKTGLNCEYPAVPQVVHQPQHQVPLFSLQDMRFFQHFLLTCFPHHPLGNDSIWTHEIPCLSQDYEFLMHAILGLAASDLIKQDPNLLTFAMMHRLKAIKAIKKTLNEVPKTNTFEEGNALLATCFALMFQSVILEDGMPEFMTFCRGIALVALQMGYKGTRLLFRNFGDQDRLDMLRPHMEAVPLIRRDWVDAAAASVRALAPLCYAGPVEAEYHRLTLAITEAMYASSFLAYESLCRHYGWWMQLPHEQFQRLIDPDSQVFTLLATHWIAVKQVMAPVTTMEYRVRSQEPLRLAPDSDKGVGGDGGGGGGGEGEGEGSGVESAGYGTGAGADLGMGRWLRYLNRQVDAEHSHYNAWPRWVEAQLERDYGFFGRSG
ncbi:hypothetical protein GGS23DRAFT_571901 [Durotheca rogersii]|uniref:uncharacterized protein n=1 Tax=Durotheca rogersii TaxID=419775 RepID=UPI00221F52FA|nr:uncharacterized protein GGS23DRAFT_571901 [Durotheca rogersii]KAI5862331.1 hypothetical protein GGS23DRAFT_571901 [Durotheca rogersii]